MLLLNLMIAIATVTQTEPTFGYIQAGMQVGVMPVFAAQVSAEFLKGGFPLSENRLQTADPLHVLLS